jgi:hypothetical protein
MNKDFPQSIAIELSKVFPDKKLLSIANYGCCAFVSVWIMGIEKPLAAITTIAEEIGKSLEADCTVHWIEFFKNVSGREIAVEFREINKLSDLNRVKGRCAVRFDYNGHSHWVGVENGKIVYNSIKHSNCVEKGKPTKARIITFK